MSPVEELQLRWHRTEGVGGAVVVHCAVTAVPSGGSVAVPIPGWSFERVALATDALPTNLGALSDWLGEFLKASLEQDETLAAARELLRGHGLELTQMPRVTAYKAQN